ncbi:phage holin family protein [Clostridium hydrogeniformans]|uniref:phage holin family protein n=1 Tax=Clostridium hydrogeniformans TaxID=349933 RepID=UPI000484273B|nr:phage holin family protein [Clostridium hydrogeniformans]
MAHNREDEKKYSNNSSLMGWIVRLILFAVVLGVTSFFTPGFSINGMWSFLLASLIITGLDYLVESFMGVDASPLGKGIKGFVIAAVIIYLTQFFVPHMSVSILGALLAALVIGIIDAVFPGRVM